MKFYPWVIGYITSLKDIYEICIKLQLGEENNYELLYQLENSCYS